MPGFLNAAAIDWSTMTTGLSAQFEDGVEAALPVVAVVLGAFLALAAIFVAIRKARGSS